MPNAIEQAVVTPQATFDKFQGVTRLALFKPDGTPVQLPSKTLLAAVTATAAANAVAAVGANPTKAEFDVVVTLLNELKADYNALLTALKA